MADESSVASSSGTRSAIPSAPLMQQQQQQQQNGTQKRKRTRGPRSCVGCRRAKQRCDLPNVTAVSPSESPQPAQLACHRCKVLKQDCIVSEPLPASYQKRAAGPSRRRSKRESLQQGLSESGPYDQSPMRRRRLQGTMDESDSLAGDDYDDDDVIVAAPPMVVGDGEDDEMDHKLVDTAIVARREHVFDPEMMEVNWNRNQYRRIQPPPPLPPPVSLPLRTEQDGSNRKSLEDDPIQRTDGVANGWTARSQGSASKRHSRDSERGPSRNAAESNPENLAVDTFVSSRPWIDSVRSSLRPYDSLRMLCYRQATFRRPPPPPSWRDAFSSRSTSSSGTPSNGPSRSASSSIKSVDQIIRTYASLLDVDQINQALESYRMHIPFIEFVHPEELSYGNTSDRAGPSHLNGRSSDSQKAQVKGQFYLGVLVYLAAKRLGIHCLEAELLDSLRQEALATLLRGPSEPDEAAALACLALYEPLLLAKHDEEWSYQGGRLATEGSFDGAGLLAAASTATSNSIDLADIAKQLVAKRTMTSNESVQLLRRASLTISLSSYTTFASLAGNIQRRPLIECPTEDLRTIQTFCSSSLPLPNSGSRSSRQERGKTGARKQDQEESREDHEENDASTVTVEEEKEEENRQEERERNAEQEERLMMLCCILRYQAVAAMRAFCQGQTAKIEQLPPSVRGEEIHEIVAESIEGLQIHVDDFTAQLRALARFIDRVSQEHLEQQRREEARQKQRRSGNSSGWYSKGSGAMDDGLRMGSGSSRKGTQSPWLIRFDWLEFELVATHFVCLSRITESTIVLYDSKIGPCNSSKTFLGRLSGHGDLFETLVFLGGHHRMIQAAHLAARISNLVLPRLINGFFGALTPPPAFTAGVALTAIQSLAEELAAVSQDSTWNKRTVLVTPKAQLSANVMRNMAQALKALDSRAPANSFPLTGRRNEGRASKKSSDSARLSAEEEKEWNDLADEEANARRNKQDEAIATSVRRHASILVTSAAITQKTSDAILNWGSVSHELRGGKGENFNSSELSRSDNFFPSQLGEQWRGSSIDATWSLQEDAYPRKAQERKQPPASGSGYSCGSPGTPLARSMPTSNQGSTPASDRMAPHINGINLDNPQRPRQGPPQKRQQETLLQRQQPRPQSLQQESGRQRQQQHQQQPDSATPFSQDASFLINFVAAQQQSQQPAQPNSTSSAGYSPVNSVPSIQQQQQQQQQRPMPPYYPSPAPTSALGFQGQQQGGGGTFPGLLYGDGAINDPSLHPGASLDEFDMLLYEIASVPIDNYFIPGA